MGAPRRAWDWLIDPELLWYHDQCHWTWEEIGRFFGHGEMWAKRRYAFAKAERERMRRREAE